MKLNLIKTSIFFVILIALVLILSGCSSSKDEAGTAILAYQQALIGGDYNKLANLSCSAWESQAKTDFDSFAAVNATLENASCASSNIEEDSAIVTCTGKIIANYGNEVLEIDLAAQSYLAVYEGGEWRMCGYR